MRRVSTSWKVIEAVLKEHAHSVYQALHPPASVGEIAALEQLIGVKLPRGLAASLEIHNGMRSGVDLFGYHSLLPVEQIRSWWRVTRDNPWDEEEVPLTDGGRIKNNLRWRDHWVPIMVTAGGDLLVVDLDPGPAGTRGQVFPWYNNGATPMRVVAESYTAWLDRLAEELLHRRFTLDEWGTPHPHHRLA